MAQKNVIQEELNALNSLKDLAESYEEIAAIQMQKIKDKVLKTRDFLADLSDVFVDLKASYVREVKDLLVRRKKGDSSLIPELQKKPKRLIVYMSSNGKLYGSVTQKTFRLLVRDLHDIPDSEADLLVIGEAGKELLENSGIGRRFEYFEMPDTGVGIDHIKKLIKHFLGYEKVFVYYGKFDNVVKQNPISTSITGEDIFETEIANQTARNDRFIFEPTLEKMFNFFETQIMSNLFSQTMLENQLARHASRVNAMEEALIHIETEGRRLHRQHLRMRKMVTNKKQLETVAGAVLWET